MKIILVKHSYQSIYYYDKKFSDTIPTIATLSTIDKENFYKSVQSLLESAQIVMPTLKTEIAKEKMNSLILSWQNFMEKNSKDVETSKNLLISEEEERQFLEKSGNGVVVEELLNDLDQTGSSRVKKMVQNIKTLLSEPFGSKISIEEIDEPIPNDPALKKVYKKLLGKK